jgi:cellulose synthase/poly-beta-1,6-N-acetylglucosamine synthase-like glycosyltransferase
MNELSMIFSLFLRITEKFLIIYFFLYLLIDLGLFTYALFTFSKKPKRKPQKVDYEGHFITLLVPAYNEEVSIVDCIKTLLQLDYPAYEVVVINDGSKDKTFEKLQNHFHLTPLEEVPQNPLDSMPVRGVFQDAELPLKVIDKENGGKADAINAGINFSKGEYVCTIDADSILDETALKMVIEPFVWDEDTMVTGGQLAASNGLHIKNNRIVRAQTPTNMWVIWQIIEYIRSFMISRTGLSRINALLIMSGAFSLYKKEEVAAVGGFLSKVNKHPFVLKAVGEGKHTVCEDMEIVVRLYRYRKEQKRNVKVTFLPRPVCWTEVPDQAEKLFKQRSRWHQGLAESLFLHRSMMLEPSFGILGMVGLPYYFFFELLAPLIKVFAIGVIVLSIWFGTVNMQWMLLMLLFAILLTAIIMSTITALVEYWSTRQSSTNRAALRYKGFLDWAWFILAGILGEFSYSFYKVFAQLNGLLGFLKGKSDWKKFERTGIQVE